MRGWVRLQHGTQTHSLVESLLMHATSGTIAEPNSNPSPCSDYQGRLDSDVHGEGCLMTSAKRASWAPNIISFPQLVEDDVAQRKFGSGTLNHQDHVVRTGTKDFPAAALPRNVSSRAKPLRRHIGIRQHPHDFFMELAALLRLQMSRSYLVSFYGATWEIMRWEMHPPPGPQRRRTQLRQSDITCRDSTQHCRGFVITVGITHRNLRTEASDFSRTLSRTKFVDGISLRKKLTPGPAASHSIPPQNWRRAIFECQCAAPRRLLPRKIGRDPPHDGRNSPIQRPLQKGMGRRCASGTK